MYYHFGITVDAADDNGWMSWTTAMKMKGNSHNKKVWMFHKSSLRRNKVLKVTTKYVATDKNVQKCGEDYWIPSEELYWLALKKYEQKIVQEYLQ